MKKILLFCIYLMVSGTLIAQKLNPVHWTYEAVKKSPKQYDVIITANIDEPWHIYSQFVTGGPIPTTIEFKKNPLIQLVGKTKEIGKLEKYFDKNFNALISTFAGKVQFIQSITLKVPSKTKFSGTIDYTACNDEKCLPPMQIPFEIIIQ